ncbi:MAG TPA: mechanosensitive ion channel family protein [Thermodesulfobacteriota bacterium]|nr:mechanosensitive ion channel family protein [Thermodesulfobacteriota bacterium]
MNSTWQNLINQGTSIGLKVLGAIALWIIGVWLIRLFMRLLAKSLERKKVDTTHVRYIVSGLTVLLKVILIVSILGYFGIQTTTFAALVAGIGIAIGAAWGGLLANIAAGAFLVFLKPFKIGDLISAAGILGTVREIGLFVTTIDTLDNVRTYIGNNKLFSDNIQNFTINPFRRVDLVAQLNHGTDHNEAIKLLKERLTKIPNVLSEPLPDVEILQFNLAGPMLAVRPYCHNDHYWQVYFDTNRLIRESFGEAGFAVPEQHLVLRNKV